MKKLFAWIFVVLLITIGLLLNTEDSRYIDSNIEYGEECLAKGDIDGAQEIINKYANLSLVDYQAYRLSLLQDTINKEKTFLINEKRELYIKKNEHINSIIISEGSTFVKKVNEK